MGQHHLAATAVALAILPAAAMAQSPSRLVPQDRPDQNPPTVRERQAPGPERPRGEAQTPVITPFVLNRVVVENSRLPQAAIEAAWAPFVGRTLDGAALIQVSDAVAAAYEKSDIAIYTVVIPNQDFAGGVMRLRALEGYIEETSIAGPEGRRNRALVEAYFDRLKSEKPLTRTSLQRYISLTRDIPGLSSNMSLLNGKTDDGVGLRAELTPHPVQVGLAVNNRGTAYLGRTQVQGDLYLNSLLRQGDQTRLTVAAPTDVELFQYYGLSHSQPLNANGTVISANIGYLRTKPISGTLEGNATSAGIQVSHPVIRSFDRNVYVTVGVDGLDSDNAFLGFTFSDDRIRAARVAVSYSRHKDDKEFYVSGSFSHGIDGLGARTLSPIATKLDFKKVNAKAGYSFRLAPTWITRLNAAGQWTTDPLPGSEQFALGGEEFGRAYEASVIAGDYAIAGSAEIAWRPDNLPQRFQGSEAYAFVDGGKVWYKGRFGFPTSDARLGSAGVGVRAQVTRNIVLAGEAAKALSNPLPFLERDDWRGIFSVRTFW